MLRSILDLFHQGLFDLMLDNILLTLLMFAAGALLLIKGGDWFVDSAVGIAKRFHVPEIIIGATVVSIGTTLPEVMVSATAAVGGNGAIAYGNAIGSIICNAALIAALTMAIRPAPVDRKAITVPVIFFFISAAVYAFAAYVMGSFERWVGIAMLVILFVYMTLTVRAGMKDRCLGRNDEHEEDSNKGGALLKDITVLVLSAALIAVGAELLEGSSVTLAEDYLHIPTEVVGVTVVALCTSLPELVTAITALAKGHGALSLGNVIGANIFNLVLVSGVAVTIAPFKVPEGSTVFGHNTSLVLEIPLMIGVMALMAIPEVVKKRLYRWQGISLLMLYTAFITVQVLIALS